MSTNQLQLKPTFEDAMKAEEKIVFLVEYLKSDQFYPEYCTEVGQPLNYIPGPCVRLLFFGGFCLNY